MTSVAGGVAKRAWDLSSDESSVLPPGYAGIEKPHLVYALPLETGVHVKENAAIIGESFSTSNTSSYAFAVYQVMMRALAQAHKMIGKRLAGDLESRGEAPFALHLEVLRESTASAAARAALAVADDASPFGAVHAAASRDGVAAVAGGAPLSMYGIDPAGRQFMRGVPDAVRVVGYRFWFYVLVSDVDLSQYVFQAVDEARRAYDDAAGGELNASGSERWRLLRDRGVLAMALDSLVGLTTLTQRAVLARVHDPTLGATENPAAPRFALDPRFIVPRASRRIAPEQRAIDSYIDSVSGVYNYPFRDHVLVVPVREHIVSRLSGYMWPDYQARRVALVALRAHLSTRARVRDAVAEVAAAEDVFGGAGDEARELAFGDAYERGAARIFDDEALHREAYETADSTAARETAAGGATAMRSPLHAFHFEGLELRERTEAAATAGNWSRERRRAAYVTNQRVLIDSYEQTCASPSAGTSVPSDRMNGWLLALERTEAGSWLGGQRPLLDERFSVFGSFLAMFMLRLETAGYISTAHAEAFRAVFAAYDAYDMEKVLHLNTVFSGPPAVSKSHLMMCLRAWLIPGTTQWVTGFTENAFATDEDMLHRIFLYDEVPPGVFNNERNTRGGTDYESIMKRILDSCVSSKLSQAFHKDAAHQQQRRNQASYSECIGTWFFTTNHPRSWMQPAMSDRVLFERFMERVRMGRTPAEMANIEESLPALERAQMRSARHQIRAMQFLRHKTEDLIHGKALTAPTLACFDICSQALVRALSKMRIEVRIRIIKRMRRLVHGLVIAQAHEYLYSSPASRWYGRDFEYASLRDLDPLLHDRREIVEYVFRTYAGQFIELGSSFVHDTLVAVVASRAKEPFTARYYNEKSQLGLDHPAPDPRAAGRTAGPAAAVSGLARGAAPVRQPRKADYYWQYYTLDMTLNELAAKCAAACLDGATRMTAAQFLPALQKMFSDTIESPVYEKTDAGTGPDALPASLRTSASPPRALPHMFSEGAMLFVAISYVHAPCNDLERAIASTRTCYTRAAHYVTATPVNEAHPDLLRVETISPKPAGERMPYHNPATARRRDASAAFPDIAASAEDEAEERRGLERDAPTRTWYYGESLDRYSARIRARTLYLDEEVDSGFGGRCDFESLDAYAAREYVIEHGRRYPEWHLRGRGPAHELARQEDAAAAASAGDDDDDVLVDDACKGTEDEEDDAGDYSYASEEDEDEHDGDGEDEDEEKRTGASHHGRSAMRSSSDDSSSSSSSSSSMAL